MLDMIKQVPIYEKFLKDLCTIKRGLNVNKKAFLTEQVSAIIQCKSPLKYKDPGCPTISVMIGGKVVEKALLDFGASVNLLPYSIYKQLGLVDFVVLDIDPFVKEANYVPIILGRPFLDTSNAIINCRNGLMQLTFGNMTLELNIFYMYKKLITPKEEEGPEEVCIIDTLVEEHCNQNTQDKLNESLEDLEEGLSEPIDVLATLQGWRRKEEILPLFNKEEAQEAVKEEIPKLNLKSLPMELKYTYLEENNQCPVVISSSLTTHREISLLEVLKRCKKAIGWKISDLKGISPLVPLGDPTQVVPKKSGITVVQNENGEEIATRLTSGWRVCIDYRKLNVVQRNIIFHSRFIDQVLERVSGHPFYCFLDKYSGISKLKLMLKIRRRPFSHVHLETYACRRMPFGLCNAPATFQRCMLSIFSDMVEQIMEVFMDDITIYGGTFEECLVNLEAVLNRYIEKDLVLNWEKCHFMVHQGIVLGHIISKKGIEVDKAKVELIVKLPSPTTIKAVRQFLGHAGFYRRFIKDFSKLSKPLCELLAKDAKFIWDERCQKIFDQLKQFLTTAPIVRALNWQLPFEVMCDASDFAIGVVLGQREDGKPYVIYYASKTLNEAQRNYTTTEKELDKKGVENVVADHLSRLAIAHNSHVLPINDDFPEESLMLLEKTPWYAHIANYLVAGEVPNQIIRKCVPEEEQQGILSHCHENACGGHFASQKTTMKVLQSSQVGVKHKVATPYHPQTSRQVELTNREIKNILMKVVITSRKDWSIKLHDSLWAYRTTYQDYSRYVSLSPSLCKACHLPMEVEYKAWWAIKRLNMDLIRAGAKRCLDLNEMEELRNDAYINSKVVKQKMKRWHDQLISNKEFWKGQRVLLYDSRLHIFPTKLKSRWIDPFIIHQVHLNGVVELLNSNGTDIFKVNVIVSRHSLTIQARK
ncbi:Retrovirus-related Pol polyprotein from transposon 17.6 [Vitis vinifera]|uniref:Retrovirus-related Pol polyprotein from transposon 17.6 n=1 Tax=Vitis vinifera TaxID=29760 RepID=A0A438H7X9_VITVI|nr:Retrovirus-related Pol polyprotein from transposon 17.6 [Vitis vinifera]